LDVYDLNNITNLIDHISHLDVVINCIGITKQISDVDIKDSIYINSLFPHLLHKITSQRGIKLIHFSTDCIFSGSEGGYKEESVSNAKDIYGKTKFLGEIIGPKALTLRKSTIGLELGNDHGLIEWWLKQKGQINGYSRAIYSGVITSELANIICLLLEEYPELEGLFNVASEPISKYEILNQLQFNLGRNDVELERDSSFECDRSLDGNEFNKITGYKPPSWQSMLSDLSLEIQSREKRKYHV
jgi:dTDP-4-dehydrorhamnose reductase